MRALILSAGLGERLRPLTLRKAKPAIEFLNMPMLAFPYFWLDQVDLTDVVFNTHYLPESIRHAALRVVKPATQVHFTHEDAILGSGGGIWNARFHLQWDPTFAVANGDGVVTFSEPDAIEQMLEHHEKSQALATLLVCPLEGVGSKIPGVWCDPYGEVVNFGKAPKKDGLHCLHFASYSFYSRRIFDRLPDGPSNILYDILEPAIAEGEVVRAFRVDRMNWFETGNISDYLRATKRCLEMLRGPDDQGLRAMLDRFAPAYQDNSDLRNSRLIADSSRVAPDSLRGFAVVGEDSTVEAGTILQDCVVLSQTRAADGRAHREDVLM